MTIAFSNLPKTVVGTAKEKYKSYTDYRKSKKATPASTYFKKLDRFFDSNFIQKCATPISDTDSTTLA